MASIAEILSGLPSSLGGDVSEYTKSEKDALDKYRHGQVLLAYELYSKVPQKKADPVIANSYEQTLKARESYQGRSVADLLCEQRCPVGCPNIDVTQLDMLE